MIKCSNRHRKASRGSSLKTDDCSVPNRACATLSLLALFPLVCFVLWVSTAPLSETRYWLYQVDWLLDINAALAVSPTFWLNLTQLGDALILLPLLSFLTVVSPRMWAAIFGSIPVSVLLLRGGKLLLDVPRPARVLDPDTFTMVGQHLAGNNSVPSGHAGTAFAAGIVVLLLSYYHAPSQRRIPVVYAIGLVTLLVAISRTVIGVHWPVDVLLGAACGVIGGTSGIWLMQRFTRWWHWMKAPTSRGYQGLVLLMWSLFLLPPLHPYTHYPTSILLLASCVAGVVSIKLLVELISYHPATRSLLPTGFVSKRVNDE